MVLGAAAWWGASTTPLRRARSFGPALWVHGLNQRAGEWLLDRASPLAPCPPAAAADAPSASASLAAARDRQASIYAWTDDDGTVHIVNDEAALPARYRRQADRLAAGLPVAEFRGRFSKIAEVGKDVAPAASVRAAKAAAGEVVAIVYSAAWCPACREAKALLGNLGVRIDERDVDRDKNAVAELKALTGGEAAIPVTVLGQTVVHGFDADRLRAAVEAARRR